MLKMTRRRLLGGTVAVAATIGTAPVRRAMAQEQPGGPDTEWRHYAADQANTRYSPLDQINADNFSDLQVAWSFKTDILGARKEYQFEPTPLLVKGRSEEHTSELQSLMRISYAVFCLKKKK